jgi:hypothetical protein
VNKKIAFISLNVDSIGYATNSYPMKNDPAFKIAIPRIEKILDKYNAKMSAFVIGKDLEDDSNIDVLKKLIERGHEIGNHSYSHYQNFAFLKDDVQSHEIEDTHNLIKKKLNYDSKGFIAPGWNSNSFTIKKLVDLNYSYDHSLAPSPLMFLAMLKMLLNYVFNYFSKKKVAHTYKIKDLFSRKDYARMFFGKQKPYPVKNSYFKSKDKKIWVIPLPTKYKLSYWMTLEYVFPKFLVNFIFKLVATRSEQFYLLIHPADFLDNNDFNNLEKTPNLERINIDVEYKLNIFENRLKQLISYGYEVKTFISQYG